MSHCVCGVNIDQTACHTVWSPGSAPEQQVSMHTHSTKTHKQEGGRKTEREEEIPGIDDNVTETNTKYSVGVQEKSLGTLTQEKQA